MRWEQNCYPSSKDKLRANDSAQRRFHANKLCQPALSDSFIPIFQSQVISQNCQTFYTECSRSEDQNCQTAFCQLLELSKSYKIGKKVKQSSMERKARCGSKLFSSWDTVMARVKFLQHMSGPWSVHVGSTMGFAVKRAQVIFDCLKQHRRKWKWLKISWLLYCFNW